jgi:hypothetical protein
MSKGTIYLFYIVMGSLGKKFFALYFELLRDAALLAMYLANAALSC